MTPTPQAPDVSQNLKSLGLGGIIGYGITSAITYTVTFFLVWQALPNPEQNVWAALGATWLAARVTQPIRVGGAVLAAGLFSRFGPKIQAKP